MACFTSSSGAVHFGQASDATEFFYLRMIETAGLRALTVSGRVSGRNGRNHALAKSGDPLGNEVSIKGKLTESGVEFRAKSRLISGWDRFGGNILELLNAPLERRNAKIRGEAAIIEAVTAAAVARISTKPELADQLIVNQLEAVGRRLSNKSRVLIEALEDLSARPPTPEQAGEGDEVLSPEFLDRFERYAEDASTEELRAKWGKVLAAEVRRPGGISRRTMRAIDEIPQSVAIRFEKLCHSRIGGQIVKGLTGDVAFEDASALAFYDLIVDPVLDGHISVFGSEKSQGGLWIFNPDHRALGLPQSKIPLFPSDSNVLAMDGFTTPALLVYLLTDVGLEIASIFDDHSEHAWQGLIAAIAADARRVGGYKITEFRRVNGKFEITGEYNIDD